LGPFIVFMIALTLSAVGIFGFISKSKAHKKITNRPEGFYDDEKATIVHPKFSKYIFGAVAIIGVIMLAGSIFTTVSAKNAGVLVTFGKVSDRTLSPGLAVKAPWQKVIEIDGTIQTDQYDAGNPLIARIGDGSQSPISLTIRWSVIETEANRVYEGFRSNDPTASFRDAVISSNLAASVQETLSGYNPIAQVEKDDGSTSNSLSLSPDYSKLATDIEDYMRAQLGDHPMAQIESVTVSYVGLSDGTQKKVDDLIASIGETRIAEQRTETAKQQAAANKILSDSLNKNPNVLVSKCLDTLEKSAETGYQMPAGFTCWPGGGSAVVVPSAANNPQ
jgi:regulator of protease activity HflC (stomatin/prohibitin superfamily)